MKRRAEIVMTGAARRRQFDSNSYKDVGRLHGVGVSV